jgi:hypothetical protein
MVMVPGLPTPQPGGGLGSAARSGRRGSGSNSLEVGSQAAQEPAAAGQPGGLSLYYNYVLLLQDVLMFDVFVLGCVTI